MMCEISQNITRNPIKEVGEDGELGRRAQAPVSCSLQVVYLSKELEAELLRFQGCPIPQHNRDETYATTDHPKQRMKLLQVPAT